MGFVFEAHPLKQTKEYTNVNLEKKGGKTNILSDMPVLFPNKSVKEKRGKETLEYK